MKSGASKLDQSTIKKFTGEGKDASWISKKMQIPVKCVAGFMPGIKKIEKESDELSPQQRGALTRKANAEKETATDAQAA